VTAEILRLASPLPPADVLTSGLGWLHDVDLRLDAPRITAPTLLLHGAADPLMPLPAARALAALIPGARLSAFDACAHAPFLSRPDDFLDQARAFVHG